MARQPKNARTEFQKNLELILRDSLMTKGEFADAVLDGDPSRITDKLIDERQAAASAAAAAEG